MNKLKHKILTNLNSGHTFHRAIYAGLCLCHVYGCMVADKPELYGVAAMLYGLLALLG